MLIQRVVVGGSVSADSSRRRISMPKFTFLCQVLLFLSLFAITGVLSNVVDEKVAYRLAMFDRNDTPFGSRRAKIDTIAAGMPANIDSTPAPTADGSESGSAADASEESSSKKAKNSRKVGDLHRKVIVEHINNLTAERIKSLLGVRSAAGLIIVIDHDIPNSSGASAISAEALARYQELERFLTSREWDAPIYFAFSDAQVAEMLRVLQGSGASNSADGVLGGLSDLRYHISIPAPEPALLTSVSATNFQGWLHSAPSMNLDSDSLPTIALIATYDAWAAAPVRTRNQSSPRILVVFLVMAAGC